MQPIVNPIKSWKVGAVRGDNHPRLGPEPVTGFIYRVDARLEQIPYQTPTIQPGRYVIIPHPNGAPPGAREIHYTGVRRLVGAGAHWLPTVCIEGDRFYLLARREQVFHEERVVRRVLDRLGHRFLVWLSYCWRTKSYRYALSTPNGHPMGTGRFHVSFPVNSDDFPCVQNELVEDVSDELVARILSWETDPAPNLLSRIVSRIPTVVTDEQAYTTTPRVGIATPPEGWASWDDTDDNEFLHRFGRAWMRCELRNRTGRAYRSSEPVPCGRMSR